jgi:hypothetical protein
MRYLIIESGIVAAGSLILQHMGAQGAVALRMPTNHERVVGDFEGH